MSWFGLLEAIKIADAAATATRQNLAPDEVLNWARRLYAIAQEALDEPDLGRPQLDVNELVPNDVPDLERDHLDGRTRPMLLLRARGDERALALAQRDEVEKGERAFECGLGGDGEDERVGRDGDALGEVGV